jgi:hypothetical protein
MAAAAAGEELTAEDIAGAGFGPDGTAHQMHPGPVLATLVHAAATDEKILATLPDGDLIGVIAAIRRIGSFTTWAEMTAIRELATRPDRRNSTMGLWRISRGLIRHGRRARGETGWAGGSRTPRLRSSRAAGLS